MAEDTAKAKPDIEKKAPALKRAEENARKPRHARERGERGSRPRRGRQTRERSPRSEFDQKILDIRRVTRVVAGGRRFSFSVTVVAGDRKGSVGVGVGKASDTALAIEKALRDAKKNMIKVHVTKSMSIPHDVSARYAASHVSILPAKGRGLVAGSAIRTVLELGGIRDVAAKILSRSKNKTNNARAAMRALEDISR